jgi:hypothetical protein
MSVPCLRLAGRLRKARKPRGLTFITRHSRSTGKVPRCSSTNLNLTAFGSRRTGGLFLGCPSRPSGYGPHDEVVHSPAQGHGPRQKPNPCHDARLLIYSRSKSQPQGHPQPGAAKARWSALFALLIYGIHLSCLCPWFISFAAQYVIKGAAQNRGRSRRYPKPATGSVDPARVAPRILPHLTS